MAVTVLEFKGYAVKEQCYQKNETFKQSTQGITLNPQIDLDIENDIQEDGILVTLGVKIGSLTDDPFRVIVRICGRFVYHLEKDTHKMGVDALIRKNAVAILYPYLRAIVSNLTSTSNEYPAYLLPTIDVAQVLKEQPGSSAVAD